MSENTEQTVRIFYGRGDIRGLGPDARLHPCGERPLRPYNEVPLATWKAFEKHPQIMGLIADGSIKVLDTPAAQADEGKSGKRAKKPAETAQAPAQAAATAAEPPAPPAPPADSEAAQALKNLGLA